MPPLEATGLEGKDKIFPNLLLWIGGLFLVVLCILALRVGPVEIATQEIFRGAWWELAERNAESIHLGQESPEIFFERYGFSYTHWVIVRDVRAPRIVWALLVGAVLACAGVGMQGLFRNPLADPGLIGVSAGASLGAILMLVWVPTFFLGALRVPLGAFIGGLVTTFIVYKLAKIREQNWAGALLLAGIAVNTFILACVGGLAYLSHDAQLRDYTFWALGSLSQASWEQVLWGMPFMLLPLAFFPILGADLNTLFLGEEQAQYLGVNVGRVRRTVILLSSAMVGSAVAFCGMIGFIGLVVPHSLRFIIGSDNRKLIPAAMIFGAMLLLGADFCLRASFSGGVELPIGIATALIGSPFFLILLRRRMSVC